MEPIANVVGAIFAVFIFFFPFILLALFVNAIRKNNAKRRQAEQDRQAKAFAEAVVAAQRSTQPTTGYASVQIPEPQKLKVIRADGKRPWYLR